MKKIIRDIAFWGSIVGIDLGIFTSIVGLGYILGKNEESLYSKRDTSLVTKKDLISNPRRLLGRPEVSFYDGNGDNVEEAYLNIKGKWYNLKYNEQAEPYVIESKNTIQDLEKRVELDR